MTESMQTLEHDHAFRASLCAWFDAPLGRSLQAAEAHRLRQLLPPLYATLAVQLGRIGKLDLLDASSAPTHVVVDVVPSSGNVAVAAVPEALPFETKSVGLMLLPHTLDFATDPHQVLREAHRVLAPEGHLVLFGFNPMSLWGLRRAISRRRHPVPWSGRFLPLLRLKDWLSLLEFELTQGGMLYYRPPIAHDAVRDHLYFIEQMGDRWWPLGGAVYVLVAQKKVLGMTRVLPRWRRRAVRVGAARPVGNMRSGHG